MTAITLHTVGPAGPVAELRLWLLPQHVFAEHVMRT